MKLSILAIHTLSHYSQPQTNLDFTQNAYQYCLEFGRFSGFAIRKKGVVKNDDGSNVWTVNFLERSRTK
ncbi:13812_t:CDS:2 [Funneliformis mosseae]|uniref:13812_t:CDS:1 n=1 Tax=Funneliformis mosseae TaxID=27381 RepID=A0A9N9D8L8_FUNMO|nr:13812_t:CDS:2 [Funneliformis mosseae]